MPVSQRDVLARVTCQDFQAQDDELTEADLQRLFLVSRQITGKINPQETISAAVAPSLHGLHVQGGPRLSVCGVKTQVLQSRRPWVSCIVMLFHFMPGPMF